MTDFTRFLEGRMAELGMLQEHLSERLKCAPAYVHLIRTGKKLPPVGSIEAWADALDLTGASRERFLDLAALERTPDRIVAMIARLQRQSRIA